MAINDKSAQAQLDSIKFACPIYPHLIRPNGFLDGSREAHALWYYYLCARQTYEDKEHEFFLEGSSVFGDKPLVPGYRQLFTSIANLYGVKPEGMAKCWDMVDMQCVSMHLPKMPDEDQYRHNRTGEIKTQ